MSFTKGWNESVPYDTDLAKYGAREIRDFKIAIRERIGLNAPIVTSNYTATLEDRIVCVDASGGNRSITLPSASGKEGRSWTVIKVDSSSNTVTVTGGSVSHTLYSQYEFVEFVIGSDGNYTKFFSTDSTPVGTILPFAGSSAPTGYLICDGSAVSRTTYANLFAVIGTTYGAGDGSTTFNLPNLKGSVPVGLDTTQTEFNTLGKTGGAKTHTLTTSELPAHTHSISSDGNHSHSVYINAPGDLPSKYRVEFMGVSSVQQCGYTSTNGAHSHGGATGSVGSGSAHNNLQPYITINYIIKY